MAVAVDRVVVGHHHQGDAAGLDGTEGADDALGGGARRQGSLGGLLDGGAVDHRVGERDAELDGIGPGGGTRFDRTLPARQAAGHVGHQQLAAGVPELPQARLQPAHLAEHGHARSAPGAPAARMSATCATSLSPRPERFTSTTLPPSEARSRVTQARAWADSRAVMIPSVRASSSKAAKTSPSAAGT